MPLFSENHVYEIVEFRLKGVRPFVPARTKNSYTSEHFCLCVLRVFLNASLKNSGIVLFKSRCVPAFNFTV